MAGGLVGLLDDVAALAKLAASSLDDIGAAAGRATTKAAGVLIDDAAVTPQYVADVAANRELPIIKRIAKGSIKNKLLFVVPAALLLSEFLPWLLTPILMIGGGYLCYEAVHKIHAKLTGHDLHEGAADKPKSEDELVAGAVRTDLILSAEIMVISLDTVTDETFWIRGITLVVVAFIITAMVYGVVAAIVKMDDVGLRLAAEGGAREDLGRALVRAMPKVLVALTVVGTAAMLWVGGHIELVALHDYGIDWPYDPIHDLEESVRGATGAMGGFLAWSVNTFFSAILGIFVGLPIVLVQRLIAARQEGAADH